MTKQEIMKMKNPGEIMRALAQNRSIWDEDLSDHLKNMKRRENLVNFGDAGIVHTPPRQNDE